MVSQSVSGSRCLERDVLVVQHGMWVVQMIQESFLIFRPLMDIEIFTVSSGDISPW